MRDASPECPVGVPTGPAREDVHLCPTISCEASGRGAPMLMPRDGPERIVMTVLRFIAAARDTGDAVCWDVAFDRAEAAFGARAGALLVARAGALLRCLEREAVAIRFLPPPCRRLSPGEADLLEALRTRRGGRRTAAGLPPAALSALADVVEPLSLTPAHTEQRHREPAIPDIGVDVAIRRPGHTLKSFQNNSSESF